MRTRILILLAILLIAAPLFWYLPYPDAPGQGKGTVVLEIPRGSGVRKILSLLAAAGITDNDPRFLVLARISGLGHRLRAGEYQLRRDLSPRQILTILSSGRVLQHRITIPEGLTMVQVARLFQQRLGLDRERFLALCRDPSFIRSLGLEPDSLEGYLYPDTYLLTRDRFKSRAVITLMANRFLSVWAELNTPPPAGLSRHQVVVLASLVEKETAAPAERPLIAGVFLNRLARNMRLQSDPTVIYGLGPGFSGPLTRAHLRAPSPTNTYLISGLPPTPICNPGRAALEAALHPASTKALYFVARGDGTHVFSRTLQEHNQAVRRFRR